MPTDRQPVTLLSDTSGLYLAGSRAVAYSHVAVDMLRKQLVHQLGEDLARAIVAQSGRHGGFNDAQLLLQERSFDGVEDMLASQYELLTASGFGSFEVVSLAVDRPAGEAYVCVRCRSSPEAASQRRLFGGSTTSACWHLVGYSTGWTSAMTGMALLTIESRCVARGDAYCELETLPYDDVVGPEAAFWKRAFESTSTSLAQELAEKLATIEAQMATIESQSTAIAELSAPILQLDDDLLVLPVVGAVDQARARSMTERLLPEIVRRRARGVIMDVTGVASLNAETADHLIGMARAATLLGTRMVLTGISPAVAEVLVTDDVHLAGLVTRRSLQDGIRYFKGLAARRR